MNAHSVIVVTADGHDPISCRSEGQVHDAFFHNAGHHTQRGGCAVAVQVPDVHVGFDVTRGDDLLARVEGNAGHLVGVTHVECLFLGGRVVHYTQGSGVVHNLSLGKAHSSAAEVMHVVAGIRRVVTKGPRQLQVCVRPVVAAFLFFVVCGLKDLAQPGAHLLRLVTSRGNEHLVFPCGKTGGRLHDHAFGFFLSLSDAQVGL